MNVDELIERLDDVALYLSVVDDPGNSAVKDAIQALREQQAEIDRLRDEIEGWEADNYNRQIGGE